MDKKETLKGISRAIEEQVAALLDYISNNMRGKTITIDYLEGPKGSWTGIRDFLGDENLMINMEYEDYNMDDNSVVISLSKLVPDKSEDWDITLYIDEDHKFYDRIPSSITKGLTLSAKMKESMEITL